MATRRSRALHPVQASSGSAHKTYQGCGLVAQTAITPKPNASAPTQLARRGSKRTMTTAAAMPLSCAALATVDEMLGARFRIENELATVA